VFQLGLTQRLDLSADRSSKFQTSTSREALNFNIQNMYRAIHLKLGYWNFFGAWMSELGPLAVRQHRPHSSFNRVRACEPPMPTDTVLFSPQRVRRQLGDRFGGRNEAPDQILDGDDAT
jgi:hypothetical protein